jgi:hypothetical protein
MKRLLPVLLLLLLGACDERVEVTVRAPYDWEKNGWYLYGASRITVECRPARNVDYVELFIGSAVVGVDSYPDLLYGHHYYTFAWDVTQLPESSAHKVFARAIAGGQEFLSPEVIAKVGFRSRLIVDGLNKTFSVYRLDGKMEASFRPIENAHPSYPRFRPGCHSVVFIADRELYEAPLGSNQAVLLEKLQNGIFSCDASPVSDLVAFEGYPAAIAHLFTRDGTSPRVQLTHDSDFAIIDSSRFTCIVNSTPVFSPDGSKLAYYRRSKCLVPGDPHENEYREDAFVMNSDGSNPVNLTAGVDDARFSGFTWTFDGKWVLFRSGTGPTPDGVLAANMSGRAVTGVKIASVAMACSPDDSTLAYVGTNLEHQLYHMKLVWTDDTLYAGGAGIPFVLDAYAQRSYIDWVRYSER